MTDSHSSQISQQSAPELSATPELPASRGRTVFLIVVAFAASVSLTGWISGQEEDVLVGTLSAETTTILASHDGRLADLLLEEGATVNVGDQMAQLENDSLLAEISVMRKNVEQRETQWRDSIAKAEIDQTWRLRTVDAEILQTRLKMAELLQVVYDQNTQQQASKDRLAWIRAHRKSTSPDHVFRAAAVDEEFPETVQTKAMIRHEATRNAAEVSRVQMQLCEERLKELQQLKADLPQRVRAAFGTAAAEAKLTLAKSQLQELEKRQSRRDVVSTAYGQVGQYRRRVGAAVRAGEPLVDVLDNSQQFLIVEVPANRLARLTQAKRVELRFPGGEKRDGKIGVRIAKTGSEAIRLRIEPTGKLWPAIPLGSAVEILLDSAD